tara:strand:+ start:1976 stop:4078 length:2103 start_codon:yes stop_codon:yes gene_type:complete
MKLHTLDNNVEQSHQFKTSSYRIEATAKAFSILSDGLYSNKIKAVIRELSTNAYDSHVSAGCPEKPFDVNLPTRLEPHFSIRDYGTGLSYDDCFNLYTTYFRSDKTDTNDAVGCLGLGSKSPFAYTDQFLVESFYNGTHYIFSSYKSETGEPVFSLLSQESTEEPNGMRVSMSTDPDDSHLFEEEAESVYEWFNTRPNVNTELSFSDPEAVVEGSNWKMFKGRHYGNTVVMGQISYPIDQDQFEYGSEEYRLLTETYGIQIKAEIGDVDITPSRESLSYNTRTKENLVLLISNACDELAEQSVESISNCATLWEARCKYVDVNERLGRIKTVSETIDGIELWNEEKLFTKAGYYYVEVETDLVQYSKSRYRESVSRDETKRVHPNRSSLYYQDVKKGSIGKIRHYLKEKGHGDIILIPEGCLEAVCSELGCDSSIIENVSSLESPPASHASRTYSSGGSSTSCFMIRKNSEGIWDTVATDVGVKEEDAFYVTKNRDDFFDEVDQHVGGINTLQGWLYKLEQAGVDVDKYNGKLFLLTPSKVKSMNLDCRENWTSGISDIKKLIAKTIEDNKDDFMLFHSGSDNGSTYTVGKEYDGHPATLNKIAELCKTDNDFIRFCKILCPEYQLGRESVSNIHNIARRLDVWKEVSENLDFSSSEEVAIDDMYDIMCEKYPMLRFVRSRWCEESDFTVVANYIDSMEE